MTREDRAALKRAASIISGYADTLWNSYTTLERLRRWPTDAISARANRDYDTARRVAKRLLAMAEAKACGLPRPLVARRLPELEEVNLVRDCGKEKGTQRRKVSETRCMETGYRCVRWWPL